MQLLSIVVVLLCARIAEGAYCCENLPGGDCVDCIKVNDYDGVNFVILAPHGGVRILEGLKNRSNIGCYNNETKSCTYTFDCTTDDSSECKVVTVTDEYTINLSKRIRDGVYNILGHYPMRLYSRVKRIQFDPNREKDEATFQNTYAVELFDLYRDKIKYLIEKAGGNGCLVLDLHGMGSGNPIMTQIGMKLLGKHLELNDEDLMSKVNFSSIKHLSNYSGKKFVSFVRGNDSLGKGMQDKGLEAIPSPEFPQMPDNGDTYFGAYYSPITTIYSDLEGHPADVFQMEVHSNIRSNEIWRNDFGDKLAEVLADFIRLHYDPSCKDNLCVNGKCKANITKYTCECNDGYSGKLCNEVVTCSASSINNAIPGETSITYSNTVTYTCATGHSHKSGNLTRTCTIDGSLSGTDPICSIVACSASSINNAIPDDTSIAFNNSVAYTCATGYTHVSGNLRRTCEVDGTLSGTDPMCNIVTCSASPINNAQPDITSITYGSNVVYTCDQGTIYSSGTLERTCSSDGTLSGTDPNCVDPPSYSCYKFNAWQKVKRAGLKVFTSTSKANKIVCALEPLTWTNGCGSCYYDCCKDVNECKYSPCKFGCTCINHLGTFSCRRLLSGEVCRKAHFSLDIYMQAVVIPRLMGRAKLIAFAYTLPQVALILTVFDAISIINAWPGSLHLTFGIGTDSLSLDPKALILETLEKNNFTDIEVYDAVKIDGIVCDIGHERYAANQTCLKCSPGSYSNTTFGLPCLECDPGFYQDEDGQTECKACLAGYFEMIQGSVECKPCPVGHFSPEMSTNCTKCEPGKYSFEGSAMCSLCNDGSVPNDNQSDCEQCSAGTFATSGDDECQQCEPGSYSTKGSGSCSLCNNGSVPNDNQSDCEQCSAGSFATSGDDECQQCDPGSYSTEGSASCSLCNNGSVPNDDQSGCEECEAGTFAMSGNVSCQICQVDKVSSAGAAYCEECPIGYMPSREQTNCTQNLAFNKTTDQKFSRGSSKSDEGNSNSDKRNSNSDNQGRDQESEKMGGNSKSGSRDSVKKRGKRATSGRSDSGKGSSRKSKSMSSNKGKDSGDSGNAVDGIFYETCSHSSNGKKTWWTVDLGDLYVVTDVVLQSNTDCCEGELRDITVYVGNKKNDRKSSNVWGKYTGPAMRGERIYITRIKPIVGRYVTIYRESNSNKAYLTLCEVFVLGNKAPLSNPKKNSTKGSKSSHSD